MAYFDEFPDILLPSFVDGRTSSSDFVKSKNLFKRAKIRDDFFSVATVFDFYTINGDDRPDNVAFKVYGDSTLDWVILISNNILNVRDEWPMNQYEFQRYIDNKYSTTLLTQIHHYESKEVRNTNGFILQEAGIWVDGDHSFSWSEGGKRYTQTGTTSVSNLQFEEDRNNKKRSINVIRSRYLEVIKEDMRELLTYTDSSQYVNRKLKKGSNLRILSPR